MSARAKIFGTLLAAVLAAVATSGCDDDCGDGCQRLDECIGIGLVGFDSVNECAIECEDAIDDGRASEGNVADCADCLDSNACSEILAGDCRVACEDISRP